MRAVFTTRHGGASASPYDSLNLGDHVGDLPLQVAANRVQLCHNIAAHAVFLRQVHGAAVANLNPNTPDGGLADACTTTHTQLACTIMVADCLAVLLTTRDGVRVAAAHVGWRGLVGAPALYAGSPADTSAATSAVSTDVLDAVLKSFTAPVPANIAYSATDLIAWLGPCIGRDAFEVGAEVRAAFLARFPGADACFHRVSPGKYMADLAGLARLRLRTLGFGDQQLYGNDSTNAWCTASHPSRFFSHRRDGAATGRMAACVWKV